MPLRRRIFIASPRKPSATPFATARPAASSSNLSERNGRVTLTVEDDGVGLSDGWQKSPGLGTRIMAHRAAMIGADFALDHNPTGGAFVKCSLPILPQSADNAPLKT